LRGQKRAGRTTGKGVVTPTPEKRRFICKSL
jgi:hypothetical protein